MSRPRLRLVRGFPEKTSENFVASDEDLIVQETGGPGEPPPPPGRKFKAKRLNEHVKSVYALANTLAAAVIVAALVVPSVTKTPIPNAPDIPGWVFIGLCLHAFGHLVIWFGTRREE